jgi:predicted esterase
MKHGRQAIEARAIGASWKVIPTSYLVCEEDRVVPAQGQEAMVQAARDLGAQIEVSKIKAGHSPFLSMVEETVDWVRGVAGEDVKK